MPDYPNPGVDGWSQSEGNNDNLSPKAFFSEIGTGANPSMGLAIGAYYDVFDNEPFFVNHDLDLDFAGSSMSARIAISDSTAAYPYRNDFSIGLLDDLGVNIATLHFTSNSQAFGSQFQRSWNVSLNDNDAFGAVFDNTEYNLFMSFTGNGADANYSIVLSDNFLIPNTASDSGTVTGAGASQIGNLRIGTTKGFETLGSSVVPVADWGDNFMVITDLQVIPEPSAAAVLAGLGVLGLLVRRRRA